MYDLSVPAFLCLLALLPLLLGGCSRTPTLVPQSYDPPGSTQTEDKEITLQPRSVFSFDPDGIFFSNDFEGGRLLDVEQLNPHSYAGWIRPENLPINNSAWYAFSAWSTRSQTIEITLSYIGGAHRYWPKQSTDKIHWTPLDSSRVTIADDKITATFELDLSPDTLWIAGQELISGAVIHNWQQDLSQRPYVTSQDMGMSREGRPLRLMEITETENPEAYLLVIGRQHPPEIPGSLALMRFIETLAADTELAKSFRSHFAVWAVPLVNPDGVAEGHWRHNTGGVDLNRDWYSFNQPETRIIRDHFSQLKKMNKPVLAGVDFHSTSYDIMYTVERELLNDEGFTDAWLDAIREAVPGYTLTDEPGPLGSPIAKLWFLETFNAPGFTYEVGDNTDRELLREVATAAAHTFMELALKR